LFFPAYVVVLARHSLWRWPLYPQTKACLMTRPAACLLRLRFCLGFVGPSSAALTFSKYCFTRVSSVKTACSFAWTPWSRRYACKIVRSSHSFIRRYETYRTVATQSNRQSRRRV
jgi:hypothetical protein